MSPPRFHRRATGTWVAIYALLLQALIPFGQALPGPNGASLIVCKVAGAGSTTQSPTPLRAPGALDAHGCVVCMAVHGPAFGTPDALAVSVPFTMAAPAVIADVGLELEHQFKALGFLARAPPVA